MTSYYDRQGRPITVAEWVGLYSADGGEYSRVAYDVINGVAVSTVWLGLNHRYVGDGPPLIFETMTFTDEVLGWSDRQWRYSTEGEALAGHESICAEARVLLHLIREEEE